ncbi:helix-turn-helix domain-containing protein [Reyranella soli]|uniref:helix-turn-helix domain-containing protein n=1 Tax=Reyranella soli TaxID=1230389 RepID=UPI001478B053|nr:helix-turn-helix domain-containing protein [Reyranella soli]
MPLLEQLEAWCRWYTPTFEIEPLRSKQDGFPASNRSWSVDGLAVSRVRSPPTSVWRSKTNIRKSPVDHWAITLSKSRTSSVEVGDTSLDVPAGAPFVLSVGEELRVHRTEDDDRLVLLLSRDRFSRIAHLLDAVKATILPASQGRFLADYMLVLERNLPNLSAMDVARFPNAVEAMLAACLVPSADRLDSARHQIELTLMERVRQAVRRNLRSPSLGPDKLCRETAMSRSQLYRVLESEGGAAHYIQRRRLSESFSILCDASNTHPIARIAEALCFADASSFTRAFRQEFGMTPRQVRAASLAGQAPMAAKTGGGGDLLHGF